MSEGYYRVGQVAELLKISPHKVRERCRAGLIKSKFDGTQWLIPVSEANRLLREGIPLVPKNLDEEESGTGARTNLSKSKTPSPSSTIVSERVALSNDSVAIAQNQVVKRKYDLELAEVEDHFEERDKRKAEQRATEQAKQAEAQANRDYRAWLNRWIEYGLDSVADDVPEQWKLDVHEEVTRALQEISPSYPDATVRQLVDAAVKRALEPWERQKTTAKAIRAGIDRLPHGAKSSYGEPSHWETRFIQLAQSKITQLRENASPEEARSAAFTAVDEICKEYQHQEDCEKITNNVRLDSRFSNDDENEEAREAVKEALECLPVGASSRQIEKAKDTALEPFLARIEEQKQKVKHKQACESIVGSMWIWKYGESTYEERQRATEEVRKALDASDIYATKEELEQVKEEALEAIEDEINDRVNREKAEKKANWYIDNVDHYLRKLVKEGYELGNLSELAREIKEELKPELVEQIFESEDMTEREISNFVEGYIDENYLDDDYDNDEA